jgi:hypothetical protein
MNIYEMLVFINQYDVTKGQALSYTANHLHAMYIRDEINSKTLWEALRRIMVDVINNATYP